MTATSKKSLSLAVPALLSGCGALATMPYVPSQTPDAWLRMQPFIQVHVGASAVVLVQPTTTAIVYLLGLVAFGAGFHFLRIRGNERSRRWWGIALLLWGAGALAAGTSYEAFSYYIKCAGRDVCAWTSWWEINYLLLTVASADAIVAAEAYTCAQGKLRHTLRRYAAIHFMLYAVMVTAGAVLPVRALVSFEAMLISCVPSAVIGVVLNVRRYRAVRQRLDAVLLGAWGWLALTVGAYYLYLASGWTQQLWAEGFWFSENDVLHLGLIGWMAFLVRVVAPHVVDARTEAGGDKGRSPFGV